MITKPLLIDRDDKVITFAEVPHVFWVDMIRNSVENSLYDITENSFYLFLKNLYKDYFSNGYTLIIDEHWEGHDLNNIILNSYNSSYNFFDILNYFKSEYNINHSFFKLISSNLYYLFYDRNDYMYPYLHWLHTDSFIESENRFNFVLEKEIKYKFLYLNRIPKYERVLLYDKILNSNILDNSIFSWNATNMKDYDGKKLNHIHKSIEGNFIGEFDEQRLLIEPTDVSKFSFCSILIESETEKESLFISEKTAKCFLNEMPFVVLASPNFLNCLHKLGFKTFDKWWDESYDSELDLEKRIDGIFNTIFDINTKTLSEINTMYSDMQSILLHNKKLYYEIYKGSKLRELISLPTTFNKIDNIKRNDKNLEDYFEIVSNYTLLI